MNRLELSALLEILSFLFVTIDLYGKKRLKKTNARLVSLLDKINQTLASIDNFKWNNSSDRLVMTVIYGVSGISSIVWYYHWLGTLEKDQNLSMFWLILLFAASLFGVLLAVLILLVLTLSIIWIVKSTIRMAESLLGIVNFEGLLLLIGSVLFFISKYLEL